MEPFEKGVLVVPYLYHRVSGLEIASTTNLESEPPIPQSLIHSHLE